MLHLKNVVKKITLPVLLALVMMPSLFFHTGCQMILGGAAALGTPTSSEMTIPAEYNLAAQKDKKVAVLVDQSMIHKTQANVRAHLTNALNILLHEKAGVSTKNLINYEAVADIRSNTPEYSMLTPDRIGAALGADYVLHVNVDYCSITVSQWEFINGDLTAHAELYNVETGHKIWPDDAAGRAVEVGFESKHISKDAGVSRLASGAASCIIRYLYTGPKNQFKVTDEKSDVGWGK